MALQKRFLSVMMIVFLGLAGLLFILEAYEKPEAEIQNVTEVILIAKDMAFNKDNPTITLKVGEPVRFLIKNEDKGMTHEFMIEEFELQTSPLKYGQSETINFTPTKKGRFEYFCSYHAKMMRGKVIIMD